MKRILIAGACVALLLVCVWGGISFVSAALADEPTASVPQDKYIKISPGEMSTSPDTFIGKSLQIPDRFLRLVGPGEWPAAAGASGNTHVAFRTSAAGGSSMLCFVPRSDKQAMAVIETLVENSPITILGEVKGRVGADVIFLVSKMFRGHEEPSPQQKYGVKFTLKSPTSKKTVTYNLPALGNEYTITLPDTAEDVFKTYGVPAPASAKGAPLKVIVKAELQ